MKVEVYAVLKDFFEKEFSIDAPISTVAELREMLIHQNADAKNILQLCRFAVKDEFVNDQYELKPDDNIHIIPPSSGG
ncbi:MoaD/ThiS family protein [Ferruginibacter sp. SUN002]|uniref:MoaD/ThiS family protein n=1 Tax=Ferruginibacter sp. SUN002 TaxID=2937789 RepID=UPI003D35C0F6